MISAQGLSVQVAVISSEMSVVIFSISLLVGLVAYLLTNCSPLGFVVPGSLVVSALEGPASILAIAGVAVLTWLTITIIDKRFAIIYGKRLFALTLGTSTILGTAAFLALHRSEPALFPGDALGFMVPGLIVYQLKRQKFGKSLAVTAVVTAITGTFALAMLAI